VILKFWRTVSSRAHCLLGPRRFLVGFVAVLLACAGTVGIAARAQSPSSTSSVSSIDTVGLLGGRAPCFWAVSSVVPLSRCPGLTLTSNIAGGVAQSGSWASTSGNATGLSYVGVLRVPVNTTTWEGPAWQCNQYACQHFIFQNAGTFVKGGIKNRGSLGEDYIVSQCASCSMPSDRFVVVQITSSAGHTRMYVDGDPTPLWDAPADMLGMGDNPAKAAGNAVLWDYPVSASTMLYATWATGTEVLSAAEASTLRLAALAQLPVEATTTTTVPETALRWRSLFARLGGSNRCTAFGWIAGAVGGAVSPLPSVGGAPAGCPAFTSSVPGWTVQAEPESGEPGIGSIVGGGAYGATSYVSPNPWQSGHGYLVFKLPAGNFPATLSWALFWVRLVRRVGFRRC
jgi:hypothetical protein